MVKARREVVEALAGPSKRHDNMDMLVKLQATIEAIDRAISDERQTERQPAGYVTDLSKK